MNNFWQSLDTRMANSYRFANNIHIKSDSVQLVFFYGCKGSSILFFKGWGGGCSKKIIFIIRGGLTTPIFCKLTNELSLLKFDFQLRLPISSRTSKITRLAVTLLNYIQALFIYLKYVYLATITQI